MPDDSKFFAIKREVLDMCEKYKAERPTTVMGFFKFAFECTGDLVEIVEVSTEVVKENKKETVVEALRYAFEEVNPDLPWIPEPFETKIEQWFLDNGIPALIDWLVGILNKKGIFTHA